MSQSAYETSRGPRSAVELADDAAEAVRGINHLTRDLASLVDPFDAYILLAVLNRLAYLLPQAFGQLDRSICSRVSREQLKDEGTEAVAGPMPALTISTYLRQAQVRAEHLAETLSRAHEAMSTISWAEPERG